MRRLMAWAVVWAAAPAFAAIGDPCPEGVCAAGEICFPDDAQGYCTVRCPAEGCPEGYECRADDEGVVRLCARPGPEPPAGAMLGEACGAEVGCDGALICVSGNEGQFCSRVCAGPGTCPAGFRCAPGNFCTPRPGPPGFGDPCGEGGVCAEGFVCTDHPSRQLPFCTLACDGTCPEGWQCENRADGERRCAPAAAGLPGFGQNCVVEAADPALSGCSAGHECFLAGAENYCTRACDSIDRCPDGYGCRVAGPDTGSCRRGVPDDQSFEPPNVAPIPDGGFEPPPPAGGPGGGGGGPGAGADDDDDDDGGGESGCQVGAGGGLGLLPALLLLARRRRRR